MGSEEGCLQPNGFHLNGLLPNKSASVTRVLDLERWTRAEERTAELIARIQPDWPSWERRSAVASYVQRLITQSIPCVVFSYGSVPLKTYLPDGDIDLTVFSQDLSCSDNWATEVRGMLEKEEKNDGAEYRIREVQLIHAEVKLVKCLVDNFVMDISFSQLGGLCTLCFLEQVDRYINRDHLFKRSIILIKAWCYYESRLLGAYHGLISTYALETMILYIFHVFNNSFAGPLEVLYRFLEFFSKFDWDNFCLSLLGPVPVRSLPDMTADPPRNDCDELLLSKLFLDTCSFNYSVIPSIHELKEQFVSKNLNIIDFLRANNNLGRSVSRGNFFRIRSAFAFGAQRLAGLLDCPKEHIVTEINRFFVNTWDRHGKVDCPDKCIVLARGIGQDDLQHNVKKGNGKETNSMISEEGNTRVKPLADGEVSWRSKILQNGAQFVPQLSRTSSSPELTDASSELLRGGLGGRLQNNSIPESNNSGRTGRINSASRERSPPDVDVCSSGASSRCPVDYETGEGILSGVKPVPNSVNAIRSSWMQTLGRQYELPAFVDSYMPPFTAPEALGSLNFHHGHHLASVPLIRRFNDFVPEGSGKQVDDDGFCDHGVSSSRDYNPENGLFCSKDTERKQSSDSFASDSDSSDQAKVCSYYEGKKQHEVDIENGESVGKHVDGVKTSCSSVTTCTTEVSSGNSLAGSSLVISDSLRDRIGTGSTVGPGPVIINSNQCQSQANDIGQISHEVTGKMTTFSPEISSYPTSNLVVPSFHPQSWPLAANGYPVFPVTLFPAGPVFPCVGTLPCLTYISQCEGKGATDGQCHSALGIADSVDQSNNSSRSAQHSEESTSDILSGDFVSHLNNMLYGRSCQNKQFQGPLVYQPSTVPPQFLQGQFRAGDPGTPSSSSAGDTGLPETPLVPISHHYPNQKNATGNYQRYPKVNPRNGMGTGTYLPHQEGFRDVQSSSSRYYKRNQRNHRKEKHREQEVNSSFNSKPRYADRSRQWEKPNPRFDRSAARNDRAHMEWKAYGRHSHPTYQSMGYGPTYMVYSCDPNSTYGPLEHHPADYANSSPDQPPSPSF